MCVESFCCFGGPVRLDVFLIFRARRNQTVMNQLVDYRPTILTRPVCPTFKLLADREQSCRRIALCRLPASVFLGVGALSRFWLVGVGPGPKGTRAQKRDDQGRAARQQSCLVLPHTQKERTQQPKARPEARKKATEKDEQQCQEGKKRNETNIGPYQRDQTTREQRRRPGKMHTPLAWPTERCVPPRKKNKTKLVDKDMANGRNEYII
jgi:hypothetical protein